MKDLATKIAKELACTIGPLLMTHIGRNIDIDKLSFIQFLLYVQAELNKYKPMFDEKEEAQHEYHKKIANRIAYNLYKAIKTLAIKGPIE